MNRHLLVGKPEPTHRQRTEQASMPGIKSAPRTSSKAALGQIEMLLGNAKDSLQWRSEVGLGWQRLTNERDSPRRCRILRNRLVVLPHFPPPRECLQSLLVHSQFCSGAQSILVELACRRGILVKARKCHSNINQTRFFDTDQSEVSAPWVFGRIGDHSSRHRIQVHVGKEMDEVPLFENEPCLVPALPQPAKQLVSPIEVLRYRALDSRHGLP
jgi:hypothetical protein